MLHWLTVAVFCPVGYFYPLISIVAVFAYAWLLQMLLFNDGVVDQPLVEAEHGAFEPKPAAAESN